MPKVTAWRRAYEKQKREQWEAFLAGDVKQLKLVSTVDTTAYVTPTVMSSSSLSCPRERRTEDKLLGWLSGEENLSETSLILTMSLGRMSEAAQEMKLLRRRTRLALASTFDALHCLSAVWAIARKKAPRGPPKRKPSPAEVSGHDATRIGRHKSECINFKTHLEPIRRSLALRRLRRECGRDKGVLIIDVPLFPLIAVMRIDFASTSAVIRMPFSDPASLVSSPVAARHLFSGPAALLVLKRPFPGITVIDATGSASVTISLPMI
ncbi:hypothetical protein FB45DRAFT_862994 [Roridomyces roridus]|uniref:Uncharacterized protein n=1 Tax=Roridomyces roridus TaxID=1738132 RepID=A0AAD7CAI8_9AGAR|nr:hypothetical protein FB45DRAFT_862994 [Roridomyces roridus]